MKYIYILFFFCTLSPINAQLEGNNWVMGISQSWWDTSEWACFKIDFQQDPPKFTKFPSFDFRTDITQTNVSDSNGELLMYSNGLRIHDINYNSIHGNTVFPNDSIGFNSSYPLPQGAMLLSHNDTSFTYIFSELQSFYFPDTTMNLEYGTGEVNFTRIVKDDLGKYSIDGKKESIILNTDTLAVGQLTATRHANGRDWWLTVAKYNQNRYYSILIQPDTSYVAHVEDLGGHTRTSLGQAVFSPDGTHFARYNTVAFPFSGWVDIYDFDRCSGRLSNPQNFQVSQNVRPGGIAFSENSRFLYASVWDTVYQYDMWASDIEASGEVVAVYDGFEEIYGNLELPTRFFMMQFAPNGKIYLSVPNFSTSYLHVIESPNEKGAACNFKQHGLLMPNFNHFGIANHPYYGLGALSGSPCDTLGLSSYYEAETPENEEHYTVFPNPTNRYVEVSVKEEAGEMAATFLLYGVGGKRAYFKELETDKEQLDLVALAAGVYFYSIENRRGEVIQQGSLIKL